MFKKIIIFILLLSVNNVFAYTLTREYKNKIDTISNTIFTKIEKKYSATQQNIILIKLDKKINKLKVENKNNTKNNEILSYFQENINKKINENITVTIENQTGKITPINPITSPIEKSITDVNFTNIANKIENLGFKYISQNKEFDDFLIGNYFKISDLSDMVSKSLTNYSKNNNNNLEIIIKEIDAYLNGNKNINLFTEVNNKLKTTICSYYYVHKDISASVFWVGEGADASNAYISNAMSAWDGKWEQHFKEGSENLFYFALPYNDFDENGNKRSNAKNIPWYDTSIKSNESLVKNRWVKVQYNGKIAYGQWEDVGPLLENDFSYVFGTGKPNNTFGLKAGIDLSPDFANYLGLNGSGNVNWNFIPEICVPKGDWTKTITRNGIDW